MALVDMAMSPEEAKEDYGPVCDTTDSSDMPKYSYGLRISLDDDALAKLGITSLPKVGSTMMLTAKCEVCSTSESQTQGGDREARLELQITDMDLGEAAPEKDAGSMLYAS